MTTYAAIVPFTYKMQRRLWTSIFQITAGVGCLCLLILSFSNSSSDLLGYVNAFISVGCILAAITARYPFLFIYCVELFPEEVRGFCSGIMIVSGRLVGSFAPEMAKLSTNMGLHPLVGCGSVLVVSIPLTMFMSETLKKKE